MAEIYTNSDKASVLMQIECQKDSVFDSLKIQKQALEDFLDEETRKYEHAKKEYEKAKNRYRIGIQQIEFQRINLMNTLSQQKNRYLIRTEYNFAEIEKAVNTLFYCKKEDGDDEKVKKLIQRIRNGDYGLWGSDDLENWLLNLKNENNDYSFYDII